jgi:NADPH2:quinone reductase
MIAIEIREPGEPEVLVPVERLVPEPAADEVLIRVGYSRPGSCRRD